MRARTATLWIGLLLSTGALAAPTVVRTDPANGATGVAPGELTITVIFSEGLKMNSHSIVAVDGAETPEFVGDPWWDNPTTFRAKIRVAAATAYGIGLNSRTRQGFVSADGERPLEPYVLRFSTAGGRPAGGGVAFRGGWREGETCERTITSEREMTIEAGGQTAKIIDHGRVTSAVQPLGVADGAYSRLRGQVLEIALEQTDLRTGKVEPVEQPVPACVLTATRQGDGWQVSVEGDDPGDETKQLFAAVAAADCPFAPPEPAAQGASWTLEGGALAPLAELLVATGTPKGKVACRFATTGEVQGHPTATIAHQWEVEYQVAGLTIRAVGQGETTYLTDAGKVISHQATLDLTLPEQRTEDGTVISGRGRQAITARLRYFPAGQYRELTPAGGGGGQTAIGVPGDKAELPFQASGGPDEPATRAPGGPGRVAYEPFVEPRERAYRLEAPQGWIAEGGIVRFPPDLAGALNATEAKNDLVLKSDPAGSVMMHWLPDLMFIDPAGSPAAPMFPPGSQMNGMISMPKMAPEQYVAQLVFQRLHPQAQGAKVLCVQPMPALAQRHADLARLLGMPGGFQWHAAAVTVQYAEGGVAYTERLVAVVEDWGPLGSGMWKAKDTFCYRAPTAQFNAWLPVVEHVQGSVDIDREWLRKEIEAAAQRTEGVAATMADINRIADETYQHRRETNEQIRAGMYETLTQ